MATPTRDNTSGCGCGPTGDQSSNQSAATNPAKTSGTAPTTGSSTDASRRTGPSTGNPGGNDLPSEAKTTRDSRTVEGGLQETPGRQAAGSEVTGSQGQGTPEVIDAD